jgi:hypothetical protein
MFDKAVLNRESFSDQFSHIQEEVCSKFDNNTTRREMLLICGAEIVHLCFLLWLCASSWTVQLLSWCEWVYSLYTPLKREEIWNITNKL